MTKAELRAKYTQKRQSLTREEFAALNAILCDTFFSHVDLSNAQVVHTFLPIEKKREPDTWLIIDRIQREAQHIRVAIPRVNPTTDEFDSFYFQGADQLKPNQWGIPEPQHGTPVLIEKIDIVIVPLLAFDATGHRVGYGKGYYDKFLVRCRDARKIGLSLFTQEESPVEFGPHDIALDVAVTPGKIYAFSPSN